ncbi:MAG TPA: hypothetical protein ENK14_07750 [Caldithrix sp.]|nr:hypothetical protein [Caldithrix sp.]
MNIEKKFHVKWRFGLSELTMLFLFIIQLCLQINSSAQTNGRLGTSINGAYYHSFEGKPEFSESVYSDEKYELHGLIAVWIDFFKPIFLNNSKPNRWGLRFSYFSAEELHWRSPPFSNQRAARTDYRMFAFQPFVQQRLAGGDHLQMLADLSGGVSFVYSSRESEIGFLIFPGDLTVRINSQIGLLFVIPVSKTIGIQFGPRYHFQPGKKKPNFPFHSVFLFSAGLILAK